MATVYAFSVDYDGCLADRGVVDPKMSLLIKKISLSLKQEPDSRAVLMVGSYRQSIESDVYCLKINRNGSCFPVYEDIVTEFKRIYPQLAHRFTLDKFLLADIEEKQENGAHFELAVQRSRVDLREYQALKVLFSEPIWHDQKKCGLQYVQMHHLATQFHNDTIVYCFHDNCDELILTPSHQFFSKFNFCIPENVTLLQFCYVLGRYQKQFMSIRGVGHIDFDYRENIQQFEGLLHAPIPQTQLSNTLRNRPVALNLNEHLRLTLIKSRGCFFPFWELIEIRGREFADDFIARLQNQLIQKEYDGYLLHLALDENNVEAVKTLLRKDANYLVLNQQKKHALERVMQSKNIDMITCFAEHTEIEKNDPHLACFVSALSAIAFYNWIDSLIEKKLNRLANVLLRYRLNEVAALSPYYINTYLEIKNGTLRCTKKFFSSLLQTVLEDQRQISPMVGNLRRLYFHASILPSDHFEEPVLQALCFFVNEFLNGKYSPVEELFFAILVLTPEITEKMRLVDHTQDQIMEKHYQRFLGYQAVMMGKIKEELNDLHVVSNYIVSRFACAESEIVSYLKRQHSDVPWLPLQTLIVKTPKQIILEAIRKQSIKNEDDKQIQAAFFLLQCMVAQTITLPLIVGLFDSWKRIKMKVPSCEPVSDFETVSDLLMKADDTGCGCFSFFSPGNMGFLDQLPSIVEAASRFS